jgi:hypothetical protein
MRKHVATVHEKQTPFQCSLCPKAFGLRWIRTQHIDTVHLKLEKHQCTLCQKDFTQQNSKHLNKFLKPSFMGVE